MGIFYIDCGIENPAKGERSTVVSQVMVDTGSEATWIDSSMLSKIGIEPRKKDLQFRMANGQIITRSVGYAILKVAQCETIDEVVFGRKGDLQLLGARALEGLNLKVDSRGKKLVAAGPILAAAAVSPTVGKLIQVKSRTPGLRRKRTKINMRQRTRKVAKD